MPQTEKLVGLKLFAIIILEFMNELSVTWHLGLQHTIAFHFGLTQTEFSTKTSYYMVYATISFLLGCGIGSYQMGALADKYGKIRAIGFNFFCLTIWFLLIGLVKNFYYFVALFFLIGFNSCFNTLFKASVTLWAEGQFRKNTQLLQAVTTTLGWIASIHVGIIIYQQVGCLMYLGFVVAAMNFTCFVTYYIAFKDVDEYEQELLLKQHEADQFKQIELEEKQLQNDLSGPQTQLQNKKVVAKAENNNFELSDLNLEGHKQQQIQQNLLSTNDKEVIDDDQDKTFYQIVTDKRFCYLLFGYETAWIVKFIHMKLTTVWVVLPVEKAGLGLSQTQMGFVFSITAVIVAVMTVVILPLIKAKNFTLIMTGSYLAFGFCLSYLVVVYFNSQTYVMAFLIVKETLLLFAIQLMDIGAWFELVEIIPQRIAARAIAAVGSFSNYGMIIGIFVSQNMFALIFTDPYYTELFGSFKLVVAYSPCILGFGFNLLCLIKHKSINEHRNK